MATDLQEKSENAENAEIIFRRKRRSTAFPSHPHHAR